jgi:hypothetical protein
MQHGSRIRQIDLDMMASDVALWVFKITGVNGKVLELRGARLLSYSTNGISFETGVAIAIASF